MDLGADLRNLFAVLGMTDFTVADLDAFQPWLQRRHPEVADVEARIQDELNRWLSQGSATQGHDGMWTVDLGEAPFEGLDLGFRPGDSVTRDELARLLGMEGRAALDQGMFRRAQGPFQDHLMLFHNPFDNPYGDVLSEHHIRFIGQGQPQHGDQKFSAYNRYLAEHLERGFTVHFFTKVEETGLLQYDGEVVCESYRWLYRPDEQRRVLEFALVKVDAVMDDSLEHLPSYYQKARAEIEAFTGPPRLENRRRAPTIGHRIVRDRAFSDMVKTLYLQRCCVCGEPLTKDQHTELQAAHIVGVSESGPDEARNGLSLCTRHHWAFDVGLFSLTDEHTVLMSSREPDPHGELEHRAAIHVPAEQSLQPDEFYLKHHRKKWKFTQVQAGTT